MKTFQTKIIIIDHDEKLHLAYKSFLKEDDRYKLLGIYKSINELLSNLGKVNPDIIISEASLQGISGIDGIDYIRKRKSQVKILIMSYENDFNLVREAFKKGANGYLSKPMNKERFLNAINSLEEHGVIMEHDILKKVISSFQKKSFESFSKKENQIIELLTQGFTYKMIADKLCVTPSAVNFHIQNIYVKLNVNSKSEALQKLRELEVRRLNAA
ncbi:response regulator transcription factor [Flagellimonas meridianipacifica]|uniref:DNA-binding NarL/FixJ family response regulator n=1 Tax=Flagellimonas meridianipacifica TaxID=1080225 RepID=A0A2T0MAP4_9FLAO|nr:response regulator transcription factor [Allomuricauda pacifica]PRX54568.1 DNA-binding NarL/FixJ family response regulator [Allomuricauda pacifica]